MKGVIIQQMTTRDTTINHTIIAVAYLLQSFNILLKSCLTFSDFKLSAKPFHDPFFS